MFEYTKNTNRDLPFNYYRSENFTEQKNLYIRIDVSKHTPEKVVYVQTRSGEGTHYSAIVDKQTNNALIHLTE